MQGVEKVAWVTDVAGGAGVVGWGLELSDLDADDLVLGDDRGSGVEVVETEAVFDAVVRGDDAGIEYVAVDVHVDRTARDCSLQLLGEVGSVSDELDGALVDEGLLRRVDVAGAAQDGVFGR
jgi:hypothetical protein